LCILNTPSIQQLRCKSHQCQVLGAHGGTHQHLSGVFLTFWMGAVQIYLPHLPRHPQEQSVVKISRNRGWVVGYQGRLRWVIPQLVHLCRVEHRFTLARSCEQGRGNPLVVMLG
jgi:hypothetical protein